ncbi:GGDEF domain-containing protein [Sulfurimonas sp.]|nr:GGDEF domain-containing protein [Sulfurimonas sp.]
MKQLKHNYIHSGHVFTSDEKNIKYKFIYLNYIATLAIIFTSVIGVMRLYNDHCVLGSIEIGLSFVAIGLLVMLRKDKRHIERISTALLLIAFILSMYTFIYATEQSTRIIVFILLGHGIYFLKGKKIGLYSLIFIVLLITLMQLSDTIDTKYSNFDLYTTALYVIVIFTMLNIYEYVKETQSQELEQLNQNLEYLVSKRTDELKKEKDKFEELSITDKLTNLYNRHHLEKLFEYEQNQAKRYETDYSIILIDIDNFKTINDRYGHNIGDNFLKEFASILSNSLRDTDTVGRWGGEEFFNPTSKVKSSTSNRSCE